MKGLCIEMREKGYSVSDVSWNPERKVFEMTVTDIPKTKDEDFSIAQRSVRPVKIGRGFIHSINYQKALMLYKKNCF